MKHDFEIIQYQFKDEIYIVPIFDVHYGSPGFNEKLWERTKEFILSHPHVYCVFGGDIIDNQTKNSHNPFGNTCRPFEQKQWYKQQLLDLKDKILCGTGGNHTNRKDNVASDEQIDFEVFDSAGIADKFRPNMCILKIQIGERKDYGRQTYTFAVTHGSGGGTQIGSTASKQQRALNIYEGIDCLITGHTHKPITFPTQRVVIDGKNNRVSFKTIQVLIAPSYLEYGDYAVRSQLQPAPYEDSVILLTKRKEKKLVKINDYGVIK